MNTVLLEFFVASKQYSILSSYYCAIPADSVLHSFLRKKEKIRDLSLTGKAKTFQDVICEVQELVSQDDFSISILFYTTEFLETICNARRFWFDIEFLRTAENKPVLSTQFVRIKDSFEREITERVSLLEYVVKYNFAEKGLIYNILFKDCSKQIISRAVSEELARRVFTAKKKVFCYVCKPLTTYRFCESCSTGYCKDCKREENWETCVGCEKKVCCAIQKDIYNYCAECNTNLCEYYIRCKNKHSKVCCFCDRKLCEDCLQGDTKIEWLVCCCRYVCHDKDGKDSCSPSEYYFEHRRERCSQCGR
jgi:hypothetical protein